MTDVAELLNRQAQWQKSRQSLTWPEKIRLVEQVRDSVRLLRAQPPPDPAEAPRGLSRRDEFRSR